MKIFTLPRLGSVELYRKVLDRLQAVPDPRVVVKEEMGVPRARTGVN